MSQNRETWTIPCCIFTIVLSYVFILLVPSFGLIFLTVSMLFIGILYLARTNSADTRRKSTQRLDDQSPVSSREEESVPPSETDSDLVRARFLDSESSPVPSQEEQSPEKVNGSEKLSEEAPPSRETLQERIDKLEDRVRFLRKRLAEEPDIDQTPLVHPEEDEVPQDLSVDEEEELSERAIQQLLETLEEKLQKGVISRQLYQRLRDKFLTRLKKIQDSSTEQPKRRAAKHKGR